jgi:hypothetical protein
VKTPPETELNTPLRPTTQTPQHRIENSISGSDDPPPAAQHGPASKNTSRTTGSQNHRPNTLQNPPKHQQTPKTHKIEHVKATEEIWTTAGKQNGEN